MGDYGRAIWTPSPNYWPGRQGYEPLYVVAHGTDGSCPGAVNWLCDPVAGASVHYVIDRGGTCYQLVSEEDSAWGNGIPEQGSHFLGGPNPNLITLSVETERTGGNTTPVTQEQVTTWTALLSDIRRRRGHLPLIPHAAISPLSRAHCPGPDFPMAAIDQGAAPPPPPGSPEPGAGGVVRLDKPFAARPQRLPLVFYHDWSFKRPAYTSGAGKDTVLSFDQWVWGPAVRDARTGQPDRRWYHRCNPKGACGWTPSAWVDSNAPDSVP
jgi:N-acetylmuramoyl-L-alanine amidase